MQPQTDPNYLAWLASQQAAQQAPPAPQYVAPQYAPQAPPQYAPPMPQQYPAQPAPQYAPQPQAPQAQQAPTTAGPTDFSTPPPVVNVVRPKIADIAGRLILVTPRRLERGVPNMLQPGTTQDRMTVDFIVLDGGPLYYGGNPSEGKPHTHAANPPHETLGAYWSQALLVASLERGLPQGNTPAVTLLGRLVKGQSSQAGRQAPWKLADPSAEDMQLARNYIAARAGAAIQAPYPVPQPAPQAPPQYVAPQYAPQQQGMQPAVAAAAAPAHAYLASPDAGAQYAPAQPQPAAAPIPQAPPQYAPAPAPAQPAPTGMDPAYWVTLTPEQQAGILAANAQTPWGPPAAPAAAPQYAPQQYPQPTH